MFNFLGCLFVLIFGIVIIAFALLGSVIDIILSFLGLKKRVRNDKTGFGNFGEQRTQQNNSQQQSSAGQQQGNAHHNSKIFEKDDSEYVDFEEV